MEMLYLGRRKRGGAVERSDLFASRVLRGAHRLVSGEGVAVLSVEAADEDYAL